MTAIRPRRSALYMPASNARAVEKARTIDCDVVILDLEDAVAPEMKAEARSRAAAAVAGGGFGHRELVIRVNAPDTPWFAEDIQAAAASGADAVLIPKVSAAQTLADIGLQLAMMRAPDSFRVWAMVETALAILRLDAIASCAGASVTRLDAFVVGANDLARETRMRMVPGRAPMLPWLAQTIAAARAHGLVALDAVYNDFADLDGCRLEALQGRDLGFDGKTINHPSQAQVVNAAFSPGAEELTRARAIVDAFSRPENSGKGVISLNGQMVERLHADMAAELIALDEAIRARRG